MTGRGDPVSVHLHAVLGKVDDPVFSDAGAGVNSRFVRSVFGECTICDLDDSYGCARVLMNVVSWGTRHHRKLRLRF